MMKDRSARAGLVIYAIAIIGILLAEAYVIFDQNQGGLFFALAQDLVVGGNILIILYVAHELIQSNYEPVDHRNIILWTAGLSIVGGFFGLLYQYQLQSEAISVSQPIQIQGILFALTAGGALGALIGLYRSETHLHVAKLQVQRDGFKFLNSALRHNTLNSINIITGTASNLQKDATDEQQEQLALIEEQGKAIAELIENAGVLADFFAADSTVEKEINLSEILNNEVELIRHSNDRVMIDTDIESDVTIEATPLINAAFQNLLSNAVEYNDSPEPRLEVSLTERAEMTIIEIKDNGPGIAKDKLKQFLNPGYHSEHMGLYISEKLVKHLKGEFEISNNEPQGTVVSIRLPT